MRIMADVEGMGVVNQILSPDYYMTDIEKMMSDFSTELHEELVESSPVDTAEYQGGWESPKKSGELEFTIVNRVKHAIYLVYGIERWKGKGFPKKQPYKYPNRAEGMLHDVRKVIFYKMKRFQDEVNSNV